MTDAGDADRPAAIAQGANLLSYLQLSNPETKEQIELRLATAKLPNAQMQISPDIAKFLQVLTRIIKAHRVVEIGTFTGYSALAFALALPDQGTVVTCDVDSANAAVGKEFWRASGVGSKITFVEGDAILTLSDLSKTAQATFDLMFVDADKEHYPEYFEVGLKLVRRGGIMVFDNMLRRGRVADMGQNTAELSALRKLNAKLAIDSRIDACLIPLGDGMSVVSVR